MWHSNAQLRTSFLGQSQACGLAPQGPRGPGPRRLSAPARFDREADGRRAPPREACCMYAKRFRGRRR